MVNHHYSRSGKGEWSSWNFSPQIVATKISIETLWHLRLIQIFLVTVSFIDVHLEHLFYFLQPWEPFVPLSVFSTCFLHLVAESCQLVKHSWRSSCRFRYCWLDLVINSWWRHFMLYILVINFYWKYWQTCNTSTSLLPFTMTEY